MKIECRLGCIDINNSNEVGKIIRECSEKTDDIWISGDNNYPCLGISVNGEKAVVHFFSAEQGQQYQSVGSDDYEGITEFLAGGDIWDAPNYLVVSLSKAIECVEQFIKTQELPTCIEWDRI